jgi:hypothetical protein
MLLWDSSGAAGFCHGRLLACVSAPQLTGGDLAVSNHSIAILVTMGFSAVGVVGD